MKRLRLCLTSVLRRPFEVAAVSGHSNTTSIQIFLYLINLNPTQEIVRVILFDRVLEQEWFLSGEPGD